MSHLHKTALIIFFSIALFSCTEKEANHQENESQRVTADELLESLGGFSFTVVMPDSIKPEQYAGLAIVWASGKIQPLVLSAGHKPGDEVKYICYHPVNGVFKYTTFVNDRSTGGGVSHNFPKIVLGNSRSNKARFLPEERLIRYTQDDGSVVSGRLPSNDDFDLIFHIQKETN